MIKNNTENDNYATVQDEIDWNLHNSGSFFLTGEIDEISTGEVVKWIISENISKKHTELRLFINSCGGDLYSAFGLIDIMKTSKIPIHTIGVGSLMSAAFLIFMTGFKGGRLLTRNTTVMSHQFSTYYEGKEHDVKASEKETRTVKQRMLDIIKESCNMDERAVKRKLLPPSDVWLSAQECIDLGVADAIF
jgi:ATP-dependent Clp protease protease subunit